METEIYTAFLPRITEPIPPYRPDQWIRFRDQGIARIWKKVGDQYNWSLLSTIIRQGNADALYRQLRLEINQRYREFLKGDYGEIIDQKLKEEMEEKGEMEKTA